MLLDDINNCGNRDNYVCDRFAGLSGNPPYGPMACVFDEFLNWLEEDLSNTSAKHIFMFYHEGAHPVPGGGHTGDSLESLDCPGNSVENPSTNASRPMRDKFWSLLAKYNVTANFVGHAHHNTLTWVNDIYGNNGAVYEVESGITPRLAVVNIRGDDATLRLYNTKTVDSEIIQFEPFGPIILSEDSINHAPKLYQHIRIIDGGIPVIDKKNIVLEEGQRLSVGTPLYFEAKDNDKEDKLIFSFSNLPSFLTVNDPSITHYETENGADKWVEQYRRVRITTNKVLGVAEIGDYSFDVKVSDGQLEDKININFSI